MLDKTVIIKKRIDGLATATEFDLLTKYMGLANDKSQCFCETEAQRP